MFTEVGKFGVVSWNANRINAEHCGDLLAGIVRRTFRGVIMLQEVASWPSNFSHAGWIINHQMDNLSAVVVPSDLGTNIRKVHYDECSTGVLLADVAVASAYLADSSKPF